MYKLLKDSLKIRRYLLVTILVIQFISVILSTLLPYMNGMFVDMLIDIKNVEEVIKYAITIAGVGIISLFLSYIYNLKIMKVKNNISFEINSRGILHLQKIPLEIEYEPTYMTQRLNSDSRIVVDFFFDKIITATINLFVMFFLISLLFYLSKPIFGVNPNCRIKDPSVYIGMDTYRLTENITSKRVDKVLDLCAGSGIQGICAANKANSVTLVEINHKTIPFTKFNIVLNNVEDKVRVKEGSLYENLGNTTFDEIYVNPPFIAVPQDWNFPIAGNGGENGLEITLNIIRGYKRHLNINGRAYMVGEAIGTEKEPFLIDELRTELGNDFKITVILDFKFSIEAHLRRSSYVAINMGKMNGKNADELFEKYKDWIKKVNATSVYNYYLKVERTQPAQGSIEVINMTTTWSKDDVPVLKNNKDFQIQKFPQYYAICRNGKIIAQLDDATLTFIKKIDGKLTIEEIYQKLCEENKNVANYLPRVEAIESLAEACGTLKARNIIEKCNRN